ncbi:MAG: hypothetical protein RSC85_00120 [Bacilli bacterium]
MKLNNKGFLLMETLIATLFVMGIFTVMYMNVVPLLGEYERKTNYDDIDGKYSAHLIRKTILQDSNVNTLLNNLQPFPSYKELNCTEFNKGHYCFALFTELKIEKMYITNYETTNIKNSNISDKYLKTYIDDLPKYNINSAGKYRVILKLSDNRFANIEVVK